AARPPPARRAGEADMAEGRGREGRGVSLKGAAGGALVAVPLVFGILQYLDTVDRESRKPFLEKQLQYCVDATTAAATIVTADLHKPDEVTKAKAEFHVLYWGKLAIVEDARVEGRMRLFREQVFRGDPSPDGTYTDNEHRAIDIAHACRDLVRSAWDSWLVRLGKKVGLLR
ncbi:MAG TPA: hypothetical protein VFX28_19150, partial [Methylomirabilota bacterium]|nr:hypothetical protein [Methylomirabilota bacterium]